MTPRGEGRERKCNEANVERYGGGMSSTHSHSQVHSFSLFPQRADVRERQTEWVGWREIYKTGRKEEEKYELRA